MIAYVLRLFNVSGPTRIHSKMMPKRRWERPRIAHWMQKWKTVSHPNSLAQMKCSSIGDLISTSFDVTYPDTSSYSIFLSFFLHFLLHFAHFTNNIRLSHSTFNAPARRWSTDVTLATAASASISRCMCALGANMSFRWTVNYYYAQNTADNNMITITEKDQWTKRDLWMALTGTNVILDARNVRTFAHRTICQAIQVPSELALCAIYKNALTENRTDSRNERFIRLCDVCDANITTKLIQNR